jgi:hypothetical protein
MDERGRRSVADLSKLGAQKFDVSFESGVGGLFEVVLKVGETYGQLQQVQIGIIAILLNLVGHHVSKMRVEVILKGCH